MDVEIGFSTEGTKSVKPFVLENCVPVTLAGRAKTAVTTAERNEYEFHQTMEILSRETGSSVYYVSEVTIRKTWRRLSVQSLFTNTPRNSRSNQKENKKKKTISCRARI